MAFTTILNDIRALKGAPIVKVANTKITPAQLEQIARLAIATQEYSGLDLGNCGLTPAHIAVLKGLGFTTLKADNNPLLGKAGGKAIAELGLSYCDISYSNAGGDLGGFQTILKALKMRGGTATGMTIADITKIMTNPNLTQLNLSGNALFFGNAGCLVVCKNKNLINLNLRGCDGMDDAAALLALNKNLRHLDVSNWRNVTDAGIRSIGEIGNLTSLTMIGMVRSCSKAVELNKNITHLDLSFNSTLGHAGFAAFATPDRLAKFQSLTLFSCGLTDASVDLMLQMPNLTFAQVEENPISFAKKQQLEAHIQANISRIFGTSVSNVANKTTYAGKRYADPLSKVEVAEPRHVTFGHTNVTNDLHKRIIHSNGHPGFWNDLNRGLAGAASKFDVDNDTLNDHNKLTATA